MGRERNREFSQQRISVNSRSFSETGRTLDGISVRAAEPDGFECNLLLYVFPAVLTSFQLLLRVARLRAEFRVENPTVPINTNLLQ